MITREKIAVPPLHINLGFIKQFVKALDKDGDYFQYICKIFPSLSNEKLKAGIFDESQIRQLIRDQNTYDSMNEVGSAAWLAAWSSFIEVVKNFLGNYIANNYKEMESSQMLGNFSILGINISIKVHFLHSHLD